MYLIPLPKMQKSRILWKLRAPVPLWSLYVPLSKKWGMEKTKTIGLSIKLMNNYILSFVINIRNKFKIWCGDVVCTLYYPVHVVMYTLFLSIIFNPGFCQTDNSNPNRCKNVLLSCSTCSNVYCRPLVSFNS